MKLGQTYLIRNCQIPVRGGATGELWGALAPRRGGLPPRREYWPSALGNIDIRIYWNYMVWRSVGGRGTIVWDIRSALSGIMPTNSERSMT